MAVITCIRQNRVDMIRDDVFLRNSVGVVVAGVPFRMNELNDNEEANNA